jgi:hypothetical protein
MELLQLAQTDKDARSVVQKFNHSHPIEEKQQGPRSDGRDV